MGCYYHNDRNATCTCRNCGKLICEECAVDIDGKAHCKTCITEIIKKGGNFDTPDNSRQNAPIPGSSGHSRPYVSYDEPAYKSYKRHPSSRQYSSFMTFLCSLLPGAGYMFLGLIKRGTFFLASFFLACYISAAFDSSIAGLSIVVVFFVSFFDTFRIRRLLENGEHVDDSFDDVLSFLKKHLVIIIVVLVLDIIRNLLYNSFLWYHYDYSVYNSFFAIIIIIFGAYVVYNSKIKKDQDLRDSNKHSNDTPFNDEIDDFIDKR